jgi:hypothetical protein
MAGLRIVPRQCWSSSNIRIFPGFSLLQILLQDSNRSVLLGLDIPLSVQVRLKLLLEQLAQSIAWLWAVLASTLCLVQLRLEEWRECCYCCLIKGKQSKLVSEWED